MGAAPHERADSRKGQSNGYKPRTLRTRVGTLNLLVPQDREGTFSTRLFCRYQRNEKALVLALMETYVEGVSTRKVKEVTEELCGTSFSKSTVSHLGAGLDSELEAWRNRRLEAKAYPYLFVDARYEKARVDHKVVSQGVLVVSGVRDDGLREILAVESPATSRRLHGSVAKSTIPGTSSVWWGPKSVRTSRRICERSSLRRAGSRPPGSLGQWPRSGVGKAARGWPSTSRNMSRSA